MNNLKNRNLNRPLRGLKAALCCICLSLAAFVSARAAIFCDGTPVTCSVVATGTPLAETGGGSAQFNFIKSGPVENEAVLTLQISGTAANGVDYQLLPTQISMAAGQTLATLTVLPIADGITEGTEDVTVTITASDNPCVVTGAQNSATVLIVEGSSTLGNALDDPNLVWITGGNSAWSPFSAVTHDGVDAAQSGAILDSQESWLQTSVNGPGTLTFWWKVSSEQDFDWLRFHIDGVLQQQISGEVNWQQRSYAIAQGSHTLKWRYVRDSNSSGGQNLAWLDQVSFTPGTGSPVVVSQPVDQVTWNGANLTLSAVAVGAPPLVQRWVFNETNDIPQATNATLALNDISFGQAGTYGLVVSNMLGATTSMLCRVTVTNNNPVSQVLIFSDSLVASPFETALRNLGKTFQKHTAEATFNSAVSAANRANTLVVVDAPLYVYSFGSLAAFVNGGGRVLIQAHSLVASPTLAATFQAVIESRSVVPLPVYNWGGSPVFAGLSGPVGFSEINLEEDVQKLHPLSGGVSVAGFGGSPIPGEAAVIIGNGGRTIVNGFYAEGATSTANAIQLAQNEIAFLIGIVGLPAPAISGARQPVSGQFRFDVTGTAGQRFVIEASPDMLTWTALQTNTLGTGLFTFTDPQPTTLPSKFFRLMANP